MQNKAAVSSFKDLFLNLEKSKSNERSSESFYPKIPLITCQLLIDYCISANVIYKL